MKIECVSHPGHRVLHRTWGCLPHSGSSKGVLVTRRGEGYNRCGRVGRKPEHKVEYYAHTAVRSDGTPDLDTANWQLLSTHLRRVSELARMFAEPLGVAQESKLAGLLHDLGKFRDEFQAYLRGERGSSIETQHAVFGAAWAAEDGRCLLGAALAVAGHHAGLPDCGDLHRMLGKPSLRMGHTVPELIKRF